MSIIITDLKHLIWLTARGNLYTIIVAKVNIGWDFSRDRGGDYEQLLEEVQRLCP